MLSMCWACLHTQDTSNAQHIAFKVTKKPLTILQDDEQSEPEVMTDEFSKKLEKNSWEYRYVLQ